MTDPTLLKPQLRARLRRERGALAPARRVAAAAAAASHLRDLPDWQHCRHIALYLPVGGELDPGPIAGAYRAIGASLYLPCIGADDTMTFAQWREPDPLTANRFGIPEPGPEAVRRDIDQLDLVLTPLVAWDRQGNRLGMGGGYYDRALAAGRPQRLVGLGYAFQEVDCVPAQPWDVRLEFILTDRGLHRCDGRPGETSLLSPG